MSMHFSLTLQCAACSARVTWTDERPKWRTRKPEAPPENLDEMIAEARQWCKDHPEIRGTLFGGRPENAPLLVTFPILGSPKVADLHWPEPYRYTRCPACDADITVDMHAADSDAGSDEAEAATA